MEQFFQRRLSKNKKREETESSEAKRARLQKLENSLLQKCPGKKGALVFYWSDGIRLTAGKQKESTWEAYEPHQRIYDSFYDQWDCSYDFGKVDWDVSTDRPVELTYYSY